MTHYKTQCSALMHSVSALGLRSPWPCCYKWTPALDEQVAGRNHHLYLCALQQDYMHEQLQSKAHYAISPSKRAELMAPNVISPAGFVPRGKLSQMEKIGWSSCPIATICTNNGSTCSLVSFKLEFPVCAAKPNPCSINHPAHDLPASACSE